MFDGGAALTCRDCNLVRVVSLTLGGQRIFTADVADPLDVYRFHVDIEYDQYTAVPRDAQRSVAAAAESCSKRLLHRQQEAIARLAVLHVVHARSAA